MKNGRQSLGPFADFVQFANAVNDGVGRALSFLIFVMVGVIVWEVVARYFFMAPTRWGHESSEILFGAYLILGGGYTLRYREHVRTDVLTAHFSARTRAALDAGNSLLLFVFAGAMLWAGGDFAWNSIQGLEHSQTPWGPPVYPLKAAIPVGALLILLQGVANLVCDLAILIAEEPDDER